MGVLQKLIRVSIMLFSMILIRGAMVGALYASLAVGFSLIYGVARIINLAHTAFFMLAAYSLFIFVTLLGFNTVSSVVISIVIVTGVGVASYKIVLERIREHEGPVLLVTIALAVLFQESMLLGFGSVYRSVAKFVAGNIDILGVTIPIQELQILGITVACLLGVLAFLYWTNIGLAVRVTAQDREVANLMGISGGKVCMVSVAVGVALAAVAGAVVAPTWIIEPHMWEHPLVMMFAAVILGGLGSMKGAFIGAFILGYVEVLVVFLIPEGSFIKGAVALAIMVVILLTRPEGLFGVVFEEERL